MIDFIHMVAHWFGWNQGRVVSELDEAGNVWIAFECDKCKAIQGAHMARTREERLDAHHN